jgi:hypothetical protein
MGAVSITNCTLNTKTQGFSCPRASSLTVTNCRINNSATSATTQGIAAGIDNTTAVLPASGPVSITGNTIIFSGTYTSHGILIGRGVNSGTVSDNTVTGGDYGMVVKGDHVTITRNEVVAGTLLLTTSSTPSKVQD